MRMVRRRSVLSTIVIALGFTALTASDAAASTLIQYTTSGTIDSTGVTGAPVISFVSLAENEVIPTSYLSLGSFQVAPLQDGQTTTYSHTPFTITLVVNSVDGATPSPNQTPIVLTGWLDGKITGAQKSSVRATFDPIGEIKFQTGPVENTLTIPDLRVTLVPSTTDHGLTTAEGKLVSVRVPEPASLALFLTTLAGLGLRKRLRAARQD